MSAPTIITILQSTPEPTLETIMHSTVLLEEDVRGPFFREKIIGTKVPLLWTTDAVAALFELQAAGKLD